MLKITKYIMWLEGARGRGGMKGGKDKEKGVGYHYQILLLCGETRKRSIALWLSFSHVIECSVDSEEDSVQQVLTQHHSYKKHHLIRVD